MTPSEFEKSKVESRSTSYQVKLPTFEGPLDLLLHLIRSNEIEITDIPIVEITRQYNETLLLMRELNLEVAGEYLVMASTLMHVKSRMLLPPDPEAPAGSPEDPRMELAQQLQEYERYRQVALQLAEAEAETLRTWLRPAKLVEEFEGEATVEADLFALLTAFKRMLDALEKDEAAAIRREKISLLDRIHWLLDKFKGTPRLSFTGLFEGVTSRSELIVTFLALLELVRLRAVGAVQTERFGEIEIRVLEDVDQIELNTERFLNA